MGELLALFIFTILGLAVSLVVAAGGVMSGLLTAVAKIVSHELLMRPKTRYYTFR